MSRTRVSFSIVLIFAMFGCTTDRDPVSIVDDQLSLRANEALVRQAEADDPASQILAVNQLLKVDAVRPLDADHVRRVVHAMFRIDHTRELDYVPSWERWLTTQLRSLSTSELATLYEAAPPLLYLVTTPDVRRGDTLEMTIGFERTFLTARVMERLCHPIQLVDAELHLDRNRLTDPAVKPRQLTRYDHSRWQRTLPKEHILGLSLGEHALTLRAELPLSRGGPSEPPIRIPIIINEHFTLHDYNAELVLLVKDPAAEAVLRQAFAATLHFDSERTATLHLTSKSLAPMLVGFTVSLRQADKEWPAGEYMAEEGDSMNYQRSLLFRKNAAPSRSQPLDVVLRTSRRVVGRSAFRIDLWDGEITLPSITVTSQIQPTSQTGTQTKD